MRIVLVGAGEVGYSVAKNLSSDGHNIIVIEEDEERADRVENTLDVMVVRGNGARPSVLAKAGVREDASDIGMLIACTNRDEVNLMACWIAKRMGVAHVIARAVGLEFTDNSGWARALGIDMLVSPERSVAREIEELLEVRSAMHANEIAGGRAGIYTFRIARESPIAGLSLIEARRVNPKLVMLIVCVKRGERSFVPRGSDILMADDVCYTMCYRSMVFYIERIFQPKRSRNLRKVFIVGAGKVGYQTAYRLLSNVRGIDIRMIDADRDKCEKLAGELPDALVICGSGSDRDLLISEGIESADGFVAATEHDETNLMLAVLARTLGAAKAVAVVRGPEYLGMTAHIPVDAIVNRNQTLADMITRSVRYPGSQRVLTVMEEISAEIVELTLPPTSPAIGKSLMTLRMPSGALIGLLERGGDMLIPSGRTVLEPGDKIVVFAAASAMDAAMAPFGEEIS